MSPRQGEQHDIRNRLEKTNENANQIIKNKTAQSSSLDRFAYLTENIKAIDLRIYFSHSEVKQRFVYAATCSLQNSLQMVDVGSRRKEF